MGTAVQLPIHTDMYLVSLSRRIEKLHKWSTDTSGVFMFDRRNEKKKKQQVKDKTIISIASARIRSSSGPMVVETSDSLRDMFLSFYGYAWQL